MAISTYVAVPTLAVGDKVTATRWNTIASALAFLLNPPETNATNTAGTSISNGAYNLIPFATETRDTGPSWDGAMHDNATNNSRVIATTAGYYQVDAQCSFAISGTGVRAINIRKNAGGTPGAGTDLGTGGLSGIAATLFTTVRVSARVQLAANDYIEAFAFQNSGGALSLSTTATDNYLNLRMLGS